jgi:hypothetical protein
MDIQTQDGILLRNIPDGTPDEAIKARIAQIRSGAAVKEPSDAAVTVNSVNKGIAGIPDAVLNTPQNIINLMKAGYGTAVTAAGHPDLAPDVTEPPSFVRKGFEKLGFIKPENEPTGARQRVIDALAQGAVGGMGNPAGSVRQVVTNTLTGLAGGGAAGVTKEVSGSEPLAIAASMAVPAAAGRASSGRPMNDVKAKTLANAEELGYGVPPSVKNDSFINRRLESIAGKEATRQEMRVRNQDITNEVANKELGFPKGTAVTESMLENYRDAVAQPYREIAKLSPTAASALEELKQARHDAKIYGRHADITGDPESVKRAETAQQDAKTWEGVIASEAQKAVAGGGPSRLPQDLKEARQQIAKSYDIERALNLGSGDVSLPSLGRAYDKGAPLSGDLETGAKFQQAFPLFTAEGQRQPTPGVSKSEAIASAILGTTGVAAAGPVGIAAAGIPFVSDPMRSLILSKPYQAVMGNPKGGLPNDEQALRALMIARAIAQRQGTR